METSSTIGELAKALAEAQAELGRLVASKTAEVKPRDTGKKPYKYAYADLADALAACRGALNKHGIAVTQEVHSPAGGGGVEVCTTLLHSSGEWIRSGRLLMPVRGDAQAVGSAITYARRYQLLAVVGLAPEGDDDGAKASAAAPDQLEDLRESVAAKVDALAKASGIERPQAWARACTRAGFARALGDGEGPWGCGAGQLRAIRDALKDALAETEATP